MLDIKTHAPFYSIAFVLRRFLVQKVLDVHSEIHLCLKWCVNYCSTWTKTGILINFSKLPNKNSMKICTRAWVLMCRQASILNLGGILLQNFITNMPKKLLDLSWKCYQALFSVVEQFKSIPNLPNKRSRENN